jgi:hypothetical protein
LPVTDNLYISVLRGENRRFSRENPAEKPHGGDHCDIPMRAPAMRLSRLFSASPPAGHSNADVRRISTPRFDAASTRFARTHRGAPT